MKVRLPDSIGEELIRMAETDQAMRNGAMNGEVWDSSIDKANTDNLKTMVRRYGWPTISKVGVEASQAAWLIAQHADHDIPFQVECLELMRQESNEDINVTLLAYLEDRVRVNQGQPQLYGTQFLGTAAGLQPQPIENEAHLDERREKVGLGPFEDYKKQIEAMDKARKDSAV